MLRRCRNIFMSACMSVHDGSVLLRADLTGGGEMDGVVVAGAAEDGAAEAPSGCMQPLSIPCRSPVQLPKPTPGHLISGKHVQISAVGSTAGLPSVQQ